MWRISTEYQALYQCSFVESISECEILSLKIVKLYKCQHYSVWVCIDSLFPSAMYYRQVHVLFHGRVVYFYFKCIFYSLIDVGSQTLMVCVFWLSFYHGQKCKVKGLY